MKTSKQHREAPWIVGFDSCCLSGTDDVQDRGSHRLSDPFSRHFAHIKASSNSSSPLTVNLNPKAGTDLARGTFDLGLYQRSLLDSPRSSMVSTNGSNSDLRSVSLPSITKDAPAPAAPILDGQGDSPGRGRPRCHQYDDLVPAIVDAMVYPCLCAQ
jgi:hypothetical protein